MFYIKLWSNLKNNNKVVVPIIIIAAIVWLRNRRLALTGVHILEVTGTGITVTALFAISCV